MTTYTQAIYRPIFAPIGATAITIGMLMIMYSLISFDGEVPEDTLPAIRIPDFIQDKVTPPIDILPPKKVIDSELQPKLPPIESTAGGEEGFSDPIPTITPNDEFTIDFTSSDTPISTLRVQPEYPQNALQRNIEGWAILSFDVTKTGATDNIQVVESEPGTTFDRSAIRALAKWKYLPKTVDGHAVRVNNMQTKLVFEIED